MAKKRVDEKFTVRFTVKSGSKDSLSGMIKPRIKTNGKSVSCSMTLASRRSTCLPDSTPSYGRSR